MTFTAPAFVTVPTASLGTPMARSPSPSPLKSIRTEGRVPVLARPERRRAPDATAPTGHRQVVPTTRTTASLMLGALPPDGAPAGAGPRHMVVVPTGSLPAPRRTGH